MGSVNGFAQNTQMFEFFLSMPFRRSDTIAEPFHSLE
jgi:hypothetical protein